MDLDDLPLFDPDTVPWPTTWGDWALCLVPPRMDRVWVEHALIAAVAGPGVGRFDAGYREVFLALGGLVGRLVRGRPGLVIDGMARGLVFASRPGVPARVGSFGGETFAFLRKPGYEPPGVDVERTEP